MAYYAGIFDNKIMMAGRSILTLTLKAPNIGSQGGIVNFDYIIAGTLVNTGIYRPSPIQIIYNGYNPPLGVFY